MRRIVLAAECAFLAAAALGAAKPAHVPSASAVVDKMASAYGGKAVLDSVKTQVIVQTLTIHDQPATITTTVEAPNKYLQLVHIPAFHLDITTGFDGSIAWIRDSYGNVKNVTGDQLTALRCEAIDANDPVFHPSVWPTSVRAQPSQIVDGKPYFVLVVTPKGCPASTYFVDKTSYLIARVVDPQQTVRLTAYTKGPSGEKYSKIAFVSGLQGLFTVTVASLSDNVKLDDTMFAIPPPPSPAPPSPAPSASPAAPSPAASPQRSNRR